MPILNTLVSELGISSKNVNKARYIVAAWILHSLSASQARSQLKDLGVSPNEITAFMERTKYNHDIYIWKLHALHGMRLHKRGFVSFGGEKFSPPPVVQPLTYRVAEQVLQQALKDVEPVINSLYWRKLKFIDSLMSGAAKAQLIERAILTFRWEYPFTRNPGAVLNTAVSNYSNNIIRDATCSRRMTFTGKKSDGTLESKVVGVDYLETLADPNALGPQDLALDLSRLLPFDREVVNEILSRQFEPRQIVDELTRLFQCEAKHIRDSFARVGEYLQTDTIYKLAS
jgi:hypothetical protein